MDERGNILLLLPVCRYVRAGESPISSITMLSNEAGRTARNTAVQHFLPKVWSLFRFDSAGTLCLVRKSIGLPFMRRKELNSMTIDELWDLHQEISALLATKIVAEKAVLEGRLLQLKHSIQPNHQSSAPHKRSYPVVMPKFRNPEQPSETWAGRGKTPRWLAIQLRSGKNKEEFRISEDALELT
jgi:DNA-binding protein H-NS